MNTPQNLHDPANANQTGSARRRLGFARRTGLPSAGRYWLLIALVYAVTAVPAAPAAESGRWNLDALMRQLAGKTVERASFVEKKTIALLDKPVESSGELLYRAPALLEKRTLKPKPELLRLDGDELTLERGRKTQRFGVGDYPEIASLVDSIRGTLAGDRQALERHYRLALDGAAERWALTLSPIDARVAALVHKIVIGGQGGDVRSIEIVQADGDRSLMTVERTPP